MTTLSESIDYIKLEQKITLLSKNFALENLKRSQQKKDNE